MQVQHRIAEKQTVAGDPLIEMWQSASWLQARRFQLPASQFQNCTYDKDLSGSLEDLKLAREAMKGAELLRTQSEAELQQVRVSIESLPRPAACIGGASSAEEARRRAEARVDQLEQQLSKGVAS